MNHAHLNRVLIAVVGFILLTITGRAIPGEQPAGEKSKNTAKPGHWPQWRGPNRDNRSTETGLLQAWPKNGPPLLWRVEGLGEGIGPVSVAGGRIFTTGQHDKSEFIIALDEKTGKHLWTAPAGATVRQSRLMRWLSQRTPTIDGDRLYAITNQGELLCLRTRDGMELWRKNYEKDFDGKRGRWGWCDYPLVDGNMLICAPGGSNASVIALNKLTGKPIWKTAIPNGVATYAATLNITVKGVRQYLVTLQWGRYGIAAKDGKVLWTYDRLSGSQSSVTPLVRGDEFLCASTFGGSRGLAMVKIVPKNGGFTVKEQYHKQLYVNRFQDTLIRVGEHVFANFRSRELQRIDWRTGKETWPRKRHNGMKSYLFADGRFYVRDSYEQVRLVEPTAEGPVEKGKFVIPDLQPSIGATHPVIAGGRLYLRDNDRLFCYDIQKNALKQPRAEPLTIKLPKPATDRRTLSKKVASRLDAPFVVTPAAVVPKILSLANVTKNDVVVDLGSGDGRIVIAAAKTYKARAIGYEIDKRLVNDSREQAKRQKLESLVTFRNQDLFKADLSKATVVTVYLFPEILKKLMPQFAKLKPGSRIVSHQFKIPGVKPSKVVTVKSATTGIDHQLFLYKTPLTKETPAMKEK
ncbi:MAG: PQQ-binding-like beta-propeller repeat protein [Planctomycetes bacterium]|nr:PQQ-binding-like beta-propeller repeat protein [Planctomycetota bacterium]